MSPREQHLAFFLGISCGVLAMVILSEFNTTFSHKLALFEDNQEYYADTSHQTLPKLTDNIQEPIIFNDLDTLHGKLGDSVAKILSEKVRILCWVMTQPKTLLTKAEAVKNTWGKRCNILLFMSSVENKDFPVVGLNVPEGRQHLWLKTRAAWKYVFDRHFNDADWFLKADDDSFVIVENLRYFVFHYNTSDAHYFGRHFVPFGGYNSGGSGYVFSKGTLLRFNNLLRDPHMCKLKSGAEDAEVGVCLAVAGVHPGDTRDKLGRETFHPFAPEYHLIPGIIKADNWLHGYSKWKVKSGQECCSDHTIAFHYINPKQMYVLEWFIYHVHPYGVHHIHS